MRMDTHEEQDPKCSVNNVAGIYKYVYEWYMLDNASNVYSSE